MKRIALGVGIVVALAAAILHWTGDAELGHPLAIATCADGGAVGAWCSEGQCQLCVYTSEARQDLCVDLEDGWEPVRLACSSEGTIAVLSVRDYEVLKIQTYSPENGEAFWRYPEQDLELGEPHFAHHQRLLITEDGGFLTIVRTQIGLVATRLTADGVVEWQSETPGYEVPGEVWELASGVLVEQIHGSYAFFDHESGQTAEHRPGTNMCPLGDRLLYVAEQTLYQVSPLGANEPTRLADLAFETEESPVIGLLGCGEYESTLVFALGLGSYGTAVLGLDSQTFDEVWSLEFPDLGALGRLQTGFFAAGPGDTISVVGELPERVFMRLTDLRNQEAHSRVFQVDLNLGCVSASSETSARAAMWEPFILDGTPLISNRRSFLGLGGAIEFDNEISLSAADSSSDRIWMANESGMSLLRSREMRVVDPDSIFRSAGRLEGSALLTHSGRCLASTGDPR